MTLRWPHGGLLVHVSGSFDDWKERIAMKSLGDGTHSIELEVKPGKYEYKFIVDGKWCYDEAQPHRDDGHGNINNHIEVGTP